MSLPFIEASSILFSVNSPRTIILLPSSPHPHPFKIKSTKQPPTIQPAAQEPQRCQPPTPPSTKISKPSLQPHNPNTQHHTITPLPRPPSPHANKIPSTNPHNNSKHPLSSQPSARKMGNRSPVLASSSSSSYFWSSGRWFLSRCWL